MSARALFKGRLCLGDEEVPVKLYSAVVDRKVHFRLLHKADREPVKQVMISEATNDEVPVADSHRALQLDNAIVMLRKDELDELKPEKSRRIEVLQFLPPAVIDHRWYDRAYYLGPDGDPDALAALSRMLEDMGREGLVRWTMRDKQYLGALRRYQGQPVLISLRYAEQVLPIAELPRPSGNAPGPREKQMAGQLISLLEADFEPDQYQDEYQLRMQELIDRKRRGLKGKARRPRRRPSSNSLEEALAASVKETRRAS